MSSKKIFLIFFIILFSLYGCKSKVKEEKSRIKETYPRLECINDQIWIIQHLYKRGNQPSAQYLDSEGKPYTCDRFCNETPSACNHLE